VQARSARREPPKSLPKQIDAISAARLKARARQLADPSLQEALVRLANAGARSAPDDDPWAEEPEE
jgi:hypothetical protein